MRLAVFIMACLLWMDSTNNARAAANPAARRLIHAGANALDHYRLQEAEQALRDALAELEKNPGGASQKVDAMVLLAAVLREHCQFEEALKTARQSLELSKTLGAKPRRKRMMEAHWELGLIHSMRAEYDAALRELQLAADTVLDPKTDVNLPLLLNETAMVLIECGRYTQARATLERARKLVPLYDEVHREELNAEINNNFGFYHSDLGHYQVAEQFFHKAIAWYEEHYGRNHIRTTVPRANLALMYQSMGIYKRAERILKKNLSISKRTLGEQHLLTTIDMANLAGLHSDAGRMEESLALYEQCLKITTELVGPDHPFTGVDHSNLSLAYAADGSVELAEKHLNLALAVLEKQPQAAALLGAAAFQNLAGLYADHGQFEKSEEWFQKALRVENQIAGDTSQDVANILQQYAVAKWNLGEKTAARALARQKYEIEKAVIQNVFTFTSEEERFAFLDRINPLDPLISFGSAEDIAQITLERKALVIDSLVRSQAAARKANTPEVQQLMEQIRKTTFDIIHLKTQLTLENDPTQTRTLRTQLTEKNTTLETSRKQLARLIDQPLNTANLLPRIQAGLLPGSVLVEFVEYDQYTQYQGEINPWIRSYGALIVPPAGPPQWIPLGRTKPIEKLIKEYSPTQPRSEAAYEDLLNQLHSHLIAPLLPQLPEETRMLVIAPDGQLNFLNFATLITPVDRFLCEQFDIRHITTGRDLVATGQPAQPADARLAAFANPAYGGPDRTLQSRARAATLQDLQFAPLPGTEHESAFLNQSAPTWNLKPQIFTGPQATEARLHSLQSPHILHLATHGFFLNPKASKQREETGETSIQSEELMRAGPKAAGLMHSGLALSGAAETLRRWQAGQIPDARNDGIVTAAEVRLLHLNQTWLTVLSACETGAGKVRAGEGVLGLRRAFTQAGTRNLLFTLWPISDRITAGIMQEFYQEALRDQNAPRALAEVQRKWLLKLREDEGTKLAVQLAGPFLLTFQGPEQRPAP